MASAEEQTCPEKLGIYTIKKKLAQGGMGEVYLAYDPTCDRDVAIKRIRPFLAKHPAGRARFLKEVQITANLSHPSIIPIYSLHEEADDIFYVMPYISGTTLKSLLRKVRTSEDQGVADSASVSSFMRIFMAVCNAVAYCHANNVLHRDLKPENILIGGHGQVFIVDWGLAVYRNEIVEDVTPSATKDPPPNLTRPGKVVGTLSYLPPERVHGKKATVRTDIYSLGVILYQILTLRMPFHRKTLEGCKKNIPYEVLIDALEAAPYRDVSPQLFNITKQCLAPDSSDRYSCVDSLIEDLEHYQQGLPDWIPTHILSMDQKSDWEFQEHIMVSKLVGITGTASMMEWMFLMISKERFTPNMRLSFTLQINTGSAGVGILFNVPENSDRKRLEEGYGVWFCTQTIPNVRLMKSLVTIQEHAEPLLEENRTYRMVIEKLDHRISVYVNEQLIFSYIEHIPVVGDHMGIIAKDTHFTLSEVEVATASHNATVGCLSIPDAFLTSKHFDRAYLEYSRIAQSFKGRSYGTEALFRSGVTLLEKAKRLVDHRECLNQAHLTFDQLHHTPSEPLEYLGKALVYREQQDITEEVKCLELCRRKWPKHPLNPLLERHVVFRFHELAKTDRRGVYEFGLLILMHFPDILGDKETHACIHYLATFAEKLYFFEKPSVFSSLEERYFFLSIQFAFWLNKPKIIQELRSQASMAVHEETLRFALLALEDASEVFVLDPSHFQSSVYHIEKELCDNLAPQKVRSLIDTWRKKTTLTEAQAECIGALHIWALLLEGQAQAALELLETDYQEDISHNPASIFRMLYLCALKAHGRFDSHCLENLPNVLFPPTSNLLAYSLRGDLDTQSTWDKHAFQYERIQLQRQRRLFESF